MRGVAALMVVMFHILESFTNGDHSKQIINHGYLAVDFFFLLSGFVIGYAYDDRWKSMSLKGFFKRRIIRLHPMIIMGMVIGAVTFYAQDSYFFPAISQTPLWKMLLVTLIGLTLLPVPLSMDIRGWTEMHPLNGPAWSLFFEYIANILYALIIRKLSNKVLAVLVFICGIALIHMAVTSEHGDVIGGWALTPEQLRVGFTRLLYPFFAGLLISRMIKPASISSAFLWSTLLLIIMLAFPRIGDQEHLWMNGIYDAAVIILVFPLVVYLGASGEIKGDFANKISRFLGDISYPLYIIHYPIIYLFMAWYSRHEEYVIRGEIDFKLVAVAVSVWLITLIIAYACVRLYDIPVRKWLAKKFM